MHFKEMNCLGVLHDDYSHEPLVQIARCNFGPTLAHTGRPGFSLSTHLRAFIWVVGTGKTRCVQAYCASFSPRSPPRISMTMLPLPLRTTSSVISSISTAALKDCASASFGFLRSQEQLEPTYSPHSAAALHDAGLSVFVVWCEHYISHGADSAGDREPDMALQSRQAALIHACELLTLAPLGIVL